MGNRVFICSRDCIAHHPAWGPYLIIRRYNRENAVHIADNFFCKEANCIQGTWKAISFWVISALFAAISQQKKRLMLSQQQVDAFWQNLKQHEINVYLMIVKNIGVFPSKVQIQRDEFHILHFVIALYILLFELKQQYISHTIQKHTQGPWRIYISHTNKFEDSILLLTKQRAKE